MDRALIGRLLRVAGAAGFAGVVAGVIVGGIAGRIAMRVSGALSEPGLTGVPTAAGNPVGEITLGGTLALAIFAGMIPGALAGAAYAALRPWLVPAGRWAGAVFGLALLAAIGPVVLEPFNFDFRKFGPVLLNIAMFAALFPLFGIVAAWALALAEPRILRAPIVSGWTAAGAFGGSVLAGVFALGSGALLTLIRNGFIESDPRSLLLLWFIAVPVAAQVVLSRGKGLGDARELRRAPRVVTYALLLAPVLLGTPATIQAILFLMR